MKHLILFLLLFVFVFVFCFCIHENNVFFSIVSKLVNAADILGERYVKRISFKLADSNAQVLSGESEKYVLISPDRTQWLFKTSWSKEDEINTYTAYKLANVFGIRTPEMYKFTISINGEKKFGFLQKMIPSNTAISLAPAEFLQNGQAKFNSFLLKNKIFIRLLYFDEYGEFLIDNRKSIYLTDLNNAFCEIGHASSFGDKLPYDFHRTTNIDFKKAYAFLNYVRGIDNTRLALYLKTSLVSYGLQHYIDNIVAALIRRKKTLVEDFINCYSSHPDFNREGLGHTSSFLYRVRLLQNLCKNVLKKSHFLLFSKRSNNERNFKTVSSGMAWQYLIEHFNFLSELNEVKDCEALLLLHRNLSKAENTLVSMRRNCHNLGEKIAITLYMRQGRTFKKYIYRHKTYYDYDCGDAIFIPIVYNFSVFTSLYPIDEWFSFVNYQTEGVASIVKLQGEDEYIIGLIKLINEEYDEAIRFFTIAKKNGYAYAEVEDMVRHIARIRDSLK